MKKIIKLSAIILVEKPWNEIVFCMCHCDASRATFQFLSDFFVKKWGVRKFLIKLGLIKVSPFRSTQKARTILWFYGLYIQILVRKKFNVVPLQQSNGITRVNPPVCKYKFCSSLQNCTQENEMVPLLRQIWEGTNSLQIKRIFMWLPFNVFVLCIARATGNHPLKSHNSS